MPQWITYIFSLFPICEVIDFLDTWLTDLSQQTNNTLDDVAVRIIVNMLRKAFNCPGEFRNES